jgi:hypothetical protein
MFPEPHNASLGMHEVSGRNWRIYHSQGLIMNDFIPTAPSLLQWLARQESSSLVTDRGKQYPEGSESWDPPATTRKTREYIQHLPALSVVYNVWY